MHDGSQNRKFDWQPLALSLLLIGAAMTIFFRSLSSEVRPWNMAPAGAMFLFAGARCRSWLFYVIPFAAQIAFDLVMFQTRDWSMPWESYLAFGLSIFLGWWLLRRSESPMKIGVVAFLGSMQFFLITNFAVWVGYALHPELSMGSPWYCEATWSGLLKCYEQALEFYRGTLIGDLVFSALLFGAYAWLSRAYFVTERVIPATSITEISR